MIHLLPLCMTKDMHLLLHHLPTRKFLQTFPRINHLYHLIPCSIQATMQPLDTFPPIQVLTSLEEKFQSSLRDLLAHTSLAVIHHRQITLILCHRSPNPFLHGHACCYGRTFSPSQDLCQSLLLDPCLIHRMSLRPFLDEQALHHCLYLHSSMKLSDLHEGIPTDPSLFRRL